MKRIAIIGAGVAGLAAALELERARDRGTELEYVVYEAGSRWGGVLLTEQVNGFTVEAGPDSFLTEKSWAADLCCELGLGDQLINSNDADRKTYILVKGKLVPIPDGLAFMVPTKILPIISSPLFSIGTKLRMASEWFSAKRNLAADESVSEFVDRHYGPEMVDRLAGPLLAGVYGGEASQLSIRAVLPRFAEMEEKFGSLGRGIIAARKKIGENHQPKTKSIFTSLKGGMQQLPDAMAAAIDQRNFRLKTVVRSLEQQGSNWLVFTEKEAERFDAIIVAVPAYAAAEILEKSAQDLAGELGGIPYTSSITIAFGYGNEVLNSLPPGFGFLVPRSEQKQILAATFVHTKFPHRVPPNHALIRCFLGNSKKEDMFNFLDKEIVNLVRKDLQQVLGISATPLFSRVYKWRWAMAQYTVGHLERMQRIQTALERFPNLALAGNAYQGIGIPDCLRSGQSAARRVLQFLNFSTR